MAEINFDSEFEPLPVVWQCLPKAIPDNNQRFWLQSQGPSSWSSALAQLGLVGQASTNTGPFGVYDSMTVACWQLSTRLKKKCYHSCDTQFFLELKSFWCFVLGCDQSLMTKKISCEIKFCWNWWELATDQNSTHNFAESFNHSFVSEQKHGTGHAADLNWLPVQGRASVGILPRV